MAGKPRAYSNDLDTTSRNSHALLPARILRCNGSSDEQPAAPQMRRLRSSSACLYANHAGRCYGGATLAYPIPVRHPKFHHGGGIGELAMRLLFNHRSSKVWHRLASFHLSGQAWKALKDENRVSRSYLAVTRKFSIPLPSRKIQPKSHPPSRQKVYTSSRGYYVMLHSPSPSRVVSKFAKYPLVVIVRGKTISGPQTVLTFTSPAAKINQIRCERSFVRIHCFFRRMFSFRHFFDECSTSEE